MTKILEALMNDAEFWITVFLGAVIKSLFSERHSWTRSIASALSAVWLASIATDPVLKWFDLSPTDYRIPVAAVFAITGDSIVRWIITKTNDGEFLSSIFARLMKK